MKNIIASTLLIYFSICTAYAGGPWPQPKNKGYFKLSEWWTVFDQHFTDTGAIDPNVTSGIFNTNFYGEYGVTDRLTLMINAPLFSRNHVNNLRSATTNEIITPGDAINSLGDIDLGFKYGLSPSGASIPIAATILLGIPTGATDQGAFGNLATGDGEFNQMLRLDIGKGFNIANTSSYFSVYAALNNRTQGFSEEYRLGAELGFGFLNQKLWLTSRLDIVESFKNGNTAETTTNTTIFANNTEFVGIGLEVNYYISKKVGISLGAAGALRGEVIAARPSYSVGVFYDMNK